MNKLLAIVMMITLSLVVVPCSNAKDKKFIERVGVDYRYTEDSMFSGSFVSKRMKNSAETVSLRAETRKFYKNYRVQAEITYSDHTADEHPDYGQDTGFKEISALLTLKRHFDCLFDSYIGIFGGFGYIPNFPRFENRDWADRYIESNIGHSHVTGNIGFVVGKDWDIYKNWAIRTEARARHLSDPFNSDRGKNLGGFGVGVTYTFE